MITTTTAALVAVAVALPVAVVAYLVGQHDPWFRCHVYRVERARADAHIRAQYETKLALAQEAGDFEHTTRVAAEYETRTLQSRYNRAVGELAHADAALGRLDALADRMGAGGWPVVRREIIAARRGCDLSAVEAYGTAVTA